MNEEQAWNLLSIDEKIRLLLDHTEWAVFRASMIGVIVDQRSLVSLSAARRIASGSEQKNGDTLNTMERSYCAFQEKGRANQKIDYYVASMCWRVLRDITADFNEADFNEEGYETLDAPNDIDVLYLQPVKSMPNYKQSPLARWFCNHSTELNCVCS